MEKIFQKVHVVSTTVKVLSDSDHSGAQLNGGSLQESSSCSKDTLKGEQSDTHNCHF